MPTEIRLAENKRRNSFSADEPGESSAYNQTEHPNAMPARERCPGQPGVPLELFTLGTQFAFGHGGDRPNYVGLILKPFHFPSTFFAVWQFNHLVHCQRRTTDFPCLAWN